VSEVAVGQQFEFDDDVGPSSQLLVDLQPLHVMDDAAPHSQLVDDIGDGPDNMSLISRCFVYMSNWCGMVTRNNHPYI
jgi:hypothetical protein